jgi:putative ABC transport system permease protein
MFKNYLIMSYRSLFKNKLLGIISISSLSVAIGSAVAIFVLLDSVFNFNNFHENAEQIFQVEYVVDRDGKSEIWGDSPVPLGPALEADFPQIKSSVRVADGSGTMKYNDKVFRENFRFADNGFLDIFTFPLKLGNKSASMDKNSIFLSEKTALKYFGDDSPVGKQVSITYKNGNNTTFIVQGVAEKFPVNASFAFNILIPYENCLAAGINKLTDWKEKTLATFVQVSNPDDINAIKTQMGKYLEIQNATKPDWLFKEFVFDNVLDLVMNGHKTRNSISGGIGYTGTIVFSLIGLFLLLLACFNYVNIAIGSASGRLKEIGIRKVLGSNKREIIKQFLGENILLCFIALIIGAFLAQTFFLPAFYKYANTPSLGNIFINLNVWIFLPVLLLFVGFCAGAYPAFYISKFQPANIFKGKQVIGGKKIFTRILITFQFILTFILISLSIIITQNAKYQQALDWGYDQDQIIVVPINGKQQYTTYKNEISKNPNVLSIAGTRQHIGRSSGNVVMEYEGEKNEVIKFEIGADYLETMKIRLKSGRVFNPELSMDNTQTVIVNEQFVENMNWQDPIGKYIRIDNSEYSIIGVVEDFHYRNFMAPIKPIFFHLTKEENFNYLLVKIKSGTVFKTAEFLNETWEKLFPDMPYDAFYQDQVFEAYFRGENNISKLFWIFALIALILSSMGLFGLASININKRTKEIGIRKVLGANVLSLLNLMNTQFLKLLIISTIIASPLSYLMIKSMMDNMHKFHIPITAGQFVLTFILILFTAITTISALIYRAANINPVETLKYE